MNPRHYRVKAGLTILLQLLRIPLAVILAPDVDALTDYFIIVAASIPFQFIASEFLLFRHLSLAAPRLPEMACAAIALFSLVSFASSDHVISDLGLYMGFAVGVLFNANGLRRLRSILGASAQISYELGSALLLTAGVALLSTQLPANHLSTGLLLLQTLLGVLVWVASLAATRGKSDANTPPHQSTMDRSFVYILLLMGSTYFERLYLGLVSPALLGSISLAGAATQVWRRLTLDDALLFDELIRNNDPLSVVIKARQSYRMQARWPMALLSCACLILALSWDNAAKLLPMVSAAKFMLFAHALAITNIYLASLPAAIPALNAIRARRLQPGNALLATILSSSACALGLITLHLEPGRALMAGWLLICLNAALGLASALDQNDVPDNRRSLRMDALLFFTSCIISLTLLSLH